MARQSLTLSIDLEGAAVQENPAEVARLLRQAADKAERLRDVDGWIAGEAVGLIDVNGNRVGEFYIIEES